MLMPKRVKRRKQFRGSMRGKALRGNKINYGEYGLVATEPCWIRSNQIEAARIAMTRSVKRGGQVWIKIFPDKPVTAKPAETRMGSGKGALEYWVAVVKPGRVMFEIAGVSKIEIERASERVKVIIYTAKPGIVIGKGGAEIEKVKAELQKYTDKKLIVDIKEVKRPDKDAQLVAENIALQLENRISFRRAMKSTMSRTMKAGAKGIKTAVSGRLGGADMARTEFYSEGNIPLQTLRADIDYGFAEADTTYGKVGVKAWIYNGEVLPTNGTKEGSDK